MKKISQIIKSLQVYLKASLAETHPVEAVYLFGSFARGEAGAASDMDLGFLLDEEAYKADSFGSTRPAHMTAMQIGLSLKVKTDVTILNSSSIEMAYNIITTGCRVYAKDEDEVYEYEATVRGMYYDFIPFLRELRAEFLARL